jgi:hypothetical protein
MADLYHDQSQVLLTEYLSVRGHSVTLFKQLQLLHSPRVSKVNKGMSPYRMVACVHLSLYLYIQLTTCRPLMAWDNTQPPERVDRTLM